VTAPADMDERLLDDASAWHHALAANDADWDGYTVWLEADPRHRAAIDAIALIDRMVDDHRPHLQKILPDVAGDAVPASRPVRWWLAGPIAAAIAAAVVVTIAMRPTADVSYAASTQIRHIALKGGVAVDLAPGSEIVARGGDVSRLALTRGEAYFDVAHDSRRRLAIQAGGYSVRDVGTRFAIDLADGSVLIGVSDGNVSVDKSGTAAEIQVTAGEQFSAPANGGSGGRVARVAPDAIGSWRGGRLTYGNTSVLVVAADISRYVGKTVDVDPAISDRRFSGVLTIGDGSKLLPTLGQLMALSYTVDGDRVRLAASPAR
jgi:transmembrane sensor